MHNCQPPIDALNEWLTSYPSVNGNYGHLLLEQSGENTNDLVSSLRPYFESAHLDARAHFHAEIGLDLHPDADDEGAHAQYPQCLPPSARRGLFGELMAGLTTESYDFVGEHTWAIPIFLFRYHADVEAYMFALARNAARTRQVFGRFGSDFIGISLNDQGSVVRFIAGEAKWRATLTQSVVDTLLSGEMIDDPNGSGARVRSGKGIWFEINRDSPVPHGVRQLQRLLEEHDPDGYSAAILSMDKALALTDPHPIPRTDLVLIVGNASPTRKEATSLIDWESIPTEYAAGNDLQVVEIYLNDGETLIDAIYNSLWTEEAAHAPA
jgi:hypothetical protein